VAGSVSWRSFSAAEEAAALMAVIAIVMMLVIISVTTHIRTYVLLNGNYARTQFQTSANTSDDNRKGQR